MLDLPTRLRAAVGTAGDDRDQLLAEAAREIELARFELALERAKRRTRCAGGSCRTEPPYPQKPLRIDRAELSVQFRWEYPPRPGAPTTGVPNAYWVCAVTGLAPHEIQMDQNAVKRARDWFARAAACIQYRNRQRAAERRARERRKAKGTTDGPNHATKSAGTGAAR